ncbi:hypothetical protein QQP08_026135, partial [Theobroma cacao]
MVQGSRILVAKRKVVEEMAFEECLKMVYENDKQSVFYDVCPNEGGRSVKEIGSLVLRVQRDEELLLVIGDDEERTQAVLNERLNAGFWIATYYVKFELQLLMGFS